MHRALDPQQPRLRELEGSQSHCLSAASHLHGCDRAGRFRGAGGVRHQPLGREVSDHRSVLAEGLGECHPILRLSPEVRRVIYTMDENNKRVVRDAPTIRFDVDLSSFSALDCSLSSWRRSAHRHALPARLPRTPVSARWADCSHTPALGGLPFSGLKPDSKARSFLCVSAGRTQS